MPVSSSNVITSTLHHEPTVESVIESVTESRQLVQEVKETFEGLRANAKESDYAPFDLVEQ